MRKDYYHTNYKHRRKRRRHWLNKYKNHLGCQICHYNEYAVALHFDHTSPDNKRKAVGDMLSYSIKRLIEEVRKCRVLCANCHFVETDRLRHRKRRRKEDV